VLSEAEHGYTAGSVEVSMDYFLYYTFRTKKSPFFDLVCVYTCITVIDKVLLKKEVRQKGTD
jgi:hypothetical protein